jgi:hypothetical protein
MTDPGGAAFTNNAAHTAAFIVYINGIEVPCKSVSMRYGVWQIPEMQLEMVADPVLTRLGFEDRIQVVVFYLDDTGVSASVAPEFRLFGEGEITGWGYQNTPSGRSIVFTCVNQFAIFTQLFVQFLTQLDDMIGHATHPGAGTFEVATPSSQIVFPFSLFTQGLIPGAAPGPAAEGENEAASAGVVSQDPGCITRPFDFLYNCVKNMIGAQVPEEQRTVPAVNFFTRWARLTNFHNRFAALPFFDDAGDKNIFPVLKALQTTSAIDVIAKNLIPQVQNAGSIYDMLQLVFTTMYMEIAMIPGMPLVSVDLETDHVASTDLAGGKLVEGQGDNAKKYVASQPPAPTKPLRMQNYFAKPQLLFGIPPACNVFFPSQIQMFAFDENYATQPTRLYFNDEVLHRLFKAGKSGLDETIMNALATAYPPEANAANQLRREGAKQNGKNFLIYPEEFFKGPVMDRRNIPPWLYFLKQHESTTAPPTAESPAPAPDPAAAADVYAQLQGGNPTVYELYAEYEFFRERYARRSGSLVLSFNPYVVPGFPMAVFDNRQTRVDVFAYVTTVQQKLSHRGGRSTQVSFTYGRTLQEMLDLLSQEFAGGAAVAGTAPREPVRDVRKVVQDFEESEAFYRRLFFGGRNLLHKDASFDWRKVIGYRPAVAGDAPERLFANGVSEAQLDRQPDAAPPAPVAHNLVGDREIVPLPGAQALFDNYDSAMAYNWRPICTLDEYVAFHDSVGEGAIPAQGHPRSVGARYYNRIRRLTPLTPETKLPMGATGFAGADASPSGSSASAGNPQDAESPPTAESNPASAALPGAPTPASASRARGLTSGTGPHGTNGPGDFPQTRDDWDKILLAYRANVLAGSPRT